MSKTERDAAGAPAAKARKARTGKAQAAKEPVVEIPAEETPVAGGPVAAALVAESPLAQGPGVPAVREEADGPQGGRLAVRKTYKLYIGGAFPRSESGRSYVVTSSTGGFLANASKASRKDARDAVSAARKAFAGWSGATPYNRGQILYRIAEMLESRRAQFAAELAEAGTGRAGEAVDAAIDRLVWYAGWSDKIAAVAGSANPVAGPYFNISAPEPTGVVAVVAPDDPLLGLVSVVAPVIVTGNTCVVIASERAPLPSITLAEVLATSDLPGAW
nr:hypothetical protein GCM10020093_084920 [Planobispora longispora]